MRLVRRRVHFAVAIDGTERRDESRRGRQKCLRHVRYFWLSPPSTASTWPVTKFDAFRKYDTPPAISDAVPPRFAGVESIMRCTRASGGSKGITPGATEFTVISGAEALARARVSMITPAFDAQ